MYYIGFTTSILKASSNSDELANFDKLKFIFTSANWSKPMLFNEQNELIVDFIFILSS